MSASDPLWDEGTPRLTAGRVRKGLDEDIKAARSTSATLPAALVGGLRSMADQIDALERQLRAPGTKPYDRVPLAQLQKQFDDTYGRVFGTGDDGADPLVDALHEFREQQRRDAAARDAAQPRAAD